MTISHLEYKSLTSVRFFHSLMVPGAFGVVVECNAQSSANSPSSGMISVGRSFMHVRDRPAPSKHLIRLLLIVSEMR